MGALNPFADLDRRQLDSDEIARIRSVCWTIPNGPGLCCVQRQNADRGAGRQRQAGDKPMAIHAAPLPPGKEVHRRRSNASQKINLYRFRRRRRGAKCNFGKWFCNSRKSAMNALGGTAVEFFRGAAISMAAALALVTLVGPHGDARANEAAVTDQAAPQGGDQAVAVADRPIEGTAGRLFLAAAVGEVRVEKAADIVGRKVYADRLQIAGTASLVSFSSTPARRSLSNPASGHLDAPLAQSIVTSRFGALRAQGGGGTRIHAGVDLAAPQGSRVTAALDGRVAAAGWAGSYGLLVVLDHPDGMQTRYAHLSRVAVYPGQTVKRGDVVGLVGSTGRSTGPHLHYEVRQDGRPVDPLVAAR